MRAVAFSPAAEADIGEIWDYGADRWRPDQADNYIDAIRDACYALAQGTILLYQMSITFPLGAQIERKISLANKDARPAGSAALH